MNRSFIVLLGVILIAGCSDSDEVITGDDNLIGSHWELISYRSEFDVMTTALDSIPFSFVFSFDEQDRPVRFSGYDGCNVFASAGTLLVEGNSITAIEGINTDSNDCSDVESGEYNQQAIIFHSVISDSFSYEEVDSQLFLTSTTGRELTFGPCRSVELDTGYSFCTSF